MAGNLTHVAAKSVYADLGEVTLQSTTPTEIGGICDLAGLVAKPLAVSALSRHNNFSHFWVCPSNFRRIAF